MHRECCQTVTSLGKHKRDSATPPHGCGFTQSEAELGAPEAFRGGTGVRVPGAAAPTNVSTAHVAPAPPERRICGSHSRRICASHTGQSTTKPHSRHSATRGSAQHTRRRERVAPYSPANRCTSSHKRLRSSDLNGSIAADSTPKLSDRNSTISLIVVESGSTNDANPKM